MLRRTTHKLGKRSRLRARLKASIVCLVLFTTLACSRTPDIELECTRRAPQTHGKYPPSDRVTFYGKIYPNRWPSESSCRDLFELKTCENFERRRFAVFFHVGQDLSPVLARLWKKYIKHLRKSGASVDVYLNARSLCSAFKTLRALRCEGYVTVESHNLGMDIGGFFNSIAASMTECRHYDIVLKMHDKHDIRFTKRLMGPLLNSVKAVRAVDRYFDNDTVGMIFGGRKSRLDENIYSFKRGQLDFFAFTMPVENELLQMLQKHVKTTRRYFAGGTIFAIRGDLVFKTFQLHTIESAKARMNDAESLDINWFGLMTRTYQDAARLRHTPSLVRLPGNSLFSHHHKGSLRDAQHEHAWERVLSYLSTDANLQSYVFYETAFGGVRNVEVEHIIDKYPYAEVHDRAFCKSESLRPFCLQKAMSAECILSPDTVGAECYTECRCVHASSALTTEEQTNANLRNQLQYFLKALLPAQLGGPFAQINKAPVYISECLYSAHAHRLLTHQYGPISIESTWKLAPCSRVIGLHGTQLFITIFGVALLFVENSRVHQLDSLPYAASIRQLEAGILFEKVDNRCSLTYVELHPRRTTVDSWECEGNRVWLSVEYEKVIFKSSQDSKIWNLDPISGSI